MVGWVYSLFVVLGYLFPGAFWCMLLIWAFVFFERMCFFLVRSNLFLYSVSNIFARGGSVILVHCFICMAYLFCAVGGRISSWKNGQYFIISVAMVLSCLGTLFITLSSLINGRMLLVLGILFVSFSAGCVKPNITALGADLVHRAYIVEASCRKIQHTERKVLASREFVSRAQKVIVHFFSVFYFVVNLSSFLILFITPSSVNTVLVLLSGARAPSRSILRTLQNEDISEYFVVFFISLLCAMSGLGVFILAVLQHSRHSRWTEHTNHRGTKDRLTGYSVKNNASLIVGWMLYDQTSSTWIDQGKRMDCTFHPFGRLFIVSPSQIILLNSFLLLISLPFYDSLTTKALSSISLSNTHRSKMFYGLFLIGLSYFIYFALEVCILHTKGKISILFQVPQIVVVTLGEALISVSGMTVSYNKGSSHSKSIAMSHWYINMAIGNLMVILLSLFYKYLRIPLSYQPIPYLLLIGGVISRSRHNPYTS